MDTALLRQYWKPIAVAVLVVGAFAYGRWGHTVPAKITTVVQEKLVDHYIVDDKLVDKKVQERLAEEVLKLHTRTVIVTHKDGTSVKTVTRDLDKHVEDRTKTAEVKTETKYIDRTITVDKVVKQVIDNRKSWLVSGSVGLRLPQVSLKSGKLDLGGPVYGAQLQRRILGPLYVGGYGYSSGEAGIMLGFEF